MKRKKLKKIWIIIAVVLVVVLAYPCFVTVQIVTHGYGIGSVFKIVTTGIKDQVLESSYSKTLEEALKNSDFDKENVDNYLTIEYHEKKNFIKRINNLISKGYSESDINLINEKISDTVVEKLYDHELIKDIANYLEFDYFKSENLFRYIDYYYGDYEEAVLYVNIGLDKEFYEDANVVTEFSTTVLANKYNKLDETFEPNNITQIKSSCSVGEEYLSKEAQVAFEDMCDAALNDDMHILANSAYRSYQNQQEVYDTYFNLYGQNYVDNYVALPGYSEHQTGLALDVKARDYNTFRNSPEYEWMLENSYKYGFILRYPADKQDITGYKNEAWHFRYVGKEIAKYIYENDITYDEYYAIFLDK